jgi:hypothetical protein
MRLASAARISATSTICSASVAFAIVHLHRSSAYRPETELRAQIPNAKQDQANNRQDRVSAEKRFAAIFRVEGTRSRVKNIVTICLVLLTAGMSAGQDRSGGEDVRNKFAGAWRLAWLERPGADGKVQRIDCSGIFVFTRDGHASVQVMERNPQTQAAAGPQQYSAAGYEASWGTYKLDEQAHTLTFHIEGALVRSLIGKDLPRVYEFSGKQLIVKSTRPDEHWRVAWERY